MQARTTAVPNTNFCLTENLWTKNLNWSPNAITRTNFMQVTLTFYYNLSTTFYRNLFIPKIATWRKTLRTGILLFKIKIYYLVSWRHLDMSLDLLFRRNCLNILKSWTTWFHNCFSFPSISTYPDQTRGTSWYGCCNLYLVLNWFYVMLTSRLRYHGLCWCMTTRGLIDEIVSVVCSHEASYIWGRVIPIFRDISKSNGLLNLNMEMNCYK